MIALVALLVACGGKKPPEAAVSGEGGAAPAEPAPAWAAEPLPATASTDDKVDRAARLLDTGTPDNAKRALELLQEAQGDGVDAAVVAYDVGVAWQILGDVDKARMNYEKAVQKDPALAEAWLNLGALSERAGDASAALQRYDTGLRHSPDHPGLVAGKIGALRQLKRYDEAIAEAKTALGRNAKNLDAYNNLGLVYLDQGKLELAQFVYQKALQSLQGAEENALLHANLGRVYLAQERRAEGKRELERANQLDPRNVAVLIFLAHDRLDNRDYLGAVDFLERARLVEPENADIHQNLGIAYRGVGRFDDAARAYQKALELDPKDPTPHLNLAVLYADHMQRFDDATKSIETYRAQGGQETALADAWLKDIGQQQELIRRAAERKKQADERARQAEERERLAKEHEKNVKQWEQEAQQDAPAPGDTPPPPEAPAPAPDDTQAPDGDSPGGWGGEQ